MQYLRSYIRHRWRSKRRHGVHAPFAYALGDQVLRQFPQCTYAWTEKRRNAFARKQLDAILDFIRTEPLPGLGLERIQVLEDIDPSAKIPALETHTARIITQPYRYKHLQAIVPDLEQCTIIDTWHLLLIIHHPAFIQPEYHRMH